MVPSLTRNSFYHEDGGSQSMSHLLCSQSFSRGELPLSLHVPVSSCVTEGSEQSMCRCLGNCAQLGESMTLQSVCLFACLGTRMMVFLRVSPPARAAAVSFFRHAGMGVSAAAQTLTLTILTQLCLHGNEVSQRPSDFWDPRQVHLGGWGMHQLVLQKIPSFAASPSFNPSSLGQCSQWGLGNKQTLSESRTTSGDFTVSL